MESNARFSMAVTLALLAFAAVVSAMQPEQVRAGETPWRGGRLALADFGPHKFVFDWLNKVIVALGRNFFDGNRTTTYAPVKTLLKLRKLPIRRARHFAHFAGAAYCHETLRNWTCPPCERLPHVEHVGEIYAWKGQLKAFFAVDHKAKDIIGTYRGSQNIDNFVHDLDMRGDVIKGHKNIKIHRGFHRMTLALYSKYVKKLQDLAALYPGYKLIITGHSLGGAQATITAFLLKLRQHPLATSRTIELYTYGGPRVGNQAFVDVFNSLDLYVARVVERGDFAPHCIAAASGHVHHQNELWVFNKKGSGKWKARYCSKATYEDPKCSNSLGPAYIIVDHLLSFDVDIGTCWIQKEPAETLLQFVVPLKQYIPKPLMDLLSKFSFALIPIFPTLQQLLG